MKLAILILLLAVSHLSTANADDQPSPEPSAPAAPTPDTPGPSIEQQEWITFALNIIVIIIGLLWVFLGYKLFRVVLFMAGFIVFWFVTFELLRTLLVQKNMFPLWGAYVAAAVAGVIGGLLFFIIIKLGYFLFGMLLGMLFTALLFAATPLGNLGLLVLYQFLIIVAVGILVGVCAVLLSRPLIIIGTSFNGAYLVGNVIDSQWVHSGIAELLLNVISHIQGSIEFDKSNLKPYAVLGGILVVAIVGVVVQWKFTAGEPHEEKEHNKQELSPLLTDNNV